MENETNQHVFKKDRYVKARGGSSSFIDVYCANCGQHIALYQKDGQGSLLRMYLDRIFEPKDLFDLQYNKGKELPNLKCSKCGSLIGTPMVYERENRLAFRLFRGSFTKKKSSGIYPPLKIILDSQDRGGESDEC
ncbi:MAG: hypothetical protein PHR47_00595 [Candidatus Pacebacteria bacterium]|nr:hypothetical protein [Candidatus Paceibacterota bacterium]